MLMVGSQERGVTLSARSYKAIPCPTKSGGLTWGVDIDGSLVSPGDEIQIKSQTGEIVTRTFVGLRSNWGGAGFNDNFETVEEPNVLYPLDWIVVEEI